MITQQQFDDLFNLVRNVVEIEDYRLEEEGWGYFVVSSYKKSKRLQRELKVLGWESESEHIDYRQHQVTIYFK